MHKLTLKSLLTNKSSYNNYLEGWINSPTRMGAAGTPCYNPGNDLGRCSGHMKTGPQNGNRFRFGVFELDLQAGELHRNGLKVKLQDQPYQLLAFLVERSGQVVSREEIYQQLWPDGTFVEFDSSLNVAVNKIREALGDSANSPRFLQTVPRRGYRFIAPVEKPQHFEPRAWRRWSQNSRGPAARTDVGAPRTCWDRLCGFACCRRALLAQRQRRFDRFHRGSSLCERNASGRHGVPERWNYRGDHQQSVRCSSAKSDRSNDGFSL